MEKPSWRNIVEIFAVASVVLSLVFVGYELRLSRNVAASESLAISNTLMFEDTNLVFQHPDIWRRGCLGEEISQDEELIYARLHLTNVDLWRTLYSRINTRITVTNPDIFPRWTARNRYLFPGYNEMYLRNMRFRGTDIENIDPNGQGFENAVERFYGELVESGEELVADVVYCGR